VGYFARTVAYSSGAVCISNRQQPDDVPDGQHPVRPGSRKPVKPNAGGNLEGQYLKGYQLGANWVYGNPTVPARLSDDEIAVAACLSGMMRYVETGDDFYSLAEASQDQYLTLLCQQALAQDGKVQSQTMPWAQGTV